MSLFDYVNPSTYGLSLLSPPDQPAPPDYVGAAEATAQGNMEAAQAATYANRFNQYTPYGSMEWQTPTDPSDPYSQWSSTITLSPEQQAIFNNQMAMQQGMGNIGLMGLDQMYGMFSEPFDIGEYEGARQETLDAMNARSETDIAKDREQMESEIIARGIPRGSEAYNREMELIDRRLNDARLQNEIAASDQARADRARSVEEAMLQRQTPLNEFNAFRTGAQVTQPSFQAGGMQSTTQGPDYMNAAQQTGNWNLAGWNADTAYNNMLMQGLFGMGSAYLGG